MASAPPRLVMSAWKSLFPSSRCTTASPSISAIPTDRPPTASAIVEPIGEVRAAAAPHLGAVTELADEDAEAVMLDFVQPTGSGRRAINERGFAWADEADRRYSCPAGWGGAPWCTRSNHQAEAAVD